MLVAEIHGKVVSEAQSSEDYLTSAVFGHLRYIPPCVFWEPLFAKSVGLTGGEPSLVDALAECGLSLSAYSALHVKFWPKHTTLGEPDMLLQFTASGLPTLQILVEVKLEATKSGLGEHDQLARYLRLLGDLQRLGVAVSDYDRRYVVYLTPRDSLTEVKESLRTLGNDPIHRQRLFRVQWQDVLEVAREESRCANPQAARMLAEVAEFLHRRGLEYFDGYHPARELPALGPDDGGYYTPRVTFTARFAGMTESNTLSLFEIEQGGWVQ